MKITKSTYTLSLLMLFSVCGYSQLGISGHLSEISFVGVNYTFKSKIMTEIRLQEDAYFEPVVCYFIANSEDKVNFYGGLGLNGLNRDLILPFGFNMYPLRNKSLGMHVETAIFPEDETFRGSLGLRYLFRSKK